LGDTKFEEDAVDDISFLDYLAIGLGDKPQEVLERFGDCSDYISLPQLSNRRKEYELLSLRSILLDRIHV
jgi:hypothetical protein